MRSFHIRALSAAALLAVGSPAQANAPTMAGMMQVLIDAADKMVIAPPMATQWKEFGGQYHRIEADGNFSCYSEDGTNCKYGVPSRDESVIKPLVCGVAHADKWSGQTGYDSPGHWCNDAYANLFAKWDENHVVEATSNRPILISTNPNGDPMCLSTDSKKCLTGAALVQYMQGSKPISPLVCGDAHFAQHGITGYETNDRNHWCQSPKLLTTSHVIFTKHWYSEEAQNELKKEGYEFLEPPAPGDSFTLKMPTWDSHDEYTFSIKAHTAIWPEISLSDKSGNTYLAKTRADDAHKFGEMMMILDFNSTTPTLKTGVAKPLGAASPLNEPVLQDNDVKKFNEIVVNFPQDSVVRRWNLPTPQSIDVQVLERRLGPKIQPKSSQR